MGEIPYQGKKNLRNPELTLKCMWKTFLERKMDLGF